MFGAINSNDLIVTTEEFQYAGPGPIITPACWYHNFALSPKIRIGAKFHEDKIVTSV